MLREINPELPQREEMTFRKSLQTGAHSISRIVYHIFISNTFKVAESTLCRISENQETQNLELKNSKQEKSPQGEDSDHSCPHVTIAY